jgi:hypothetical protein
MELYRGRSTSTSAFLCMILCLGCDGPSSADDPHLDGRAETDSGGATEEALSGVDGEERDEGVGGDEGGVDAQAGRPDLAGADSAGTGAGGAEEAGVEMRTLRPAECARPREMLLEGGPLSVTIDAGAHQGARFSAPEDGFVWRSMAPQGMEITQTPMTVERPARLIVQCGALTLDRRSAMPALQGTSKWTPLGPGMAIYSAKMSEEPLAQLSFSRPATLRWVYSARDAPRALTPHHLQLFWWPLPNDVDFEGDDWPSLEDLAQRSGGVARSLPLKNPEIDLEMGEVSFEIDRLGIYLLAYRPDRLIPTLKRITYRAIAGVSMGGGAAAVLSARHPDRFDFVGALGGVSDWTYMLSYAYRKLFGGFCSTPDEGQLCAPTTSADPIEHDATFLTWVHSLNGGDFNRSQYLKIYKDMALAFGNPTTFSLESAYVPPGVPLDSLLQSNRHRCRAECREEPCPQNEDPIRLVQFFDGEYNPEGLYPVIPFCDSEDGVPYGVFDGTKEHDIPTDILLAVDLNDNGRRDETEPVIRQYFEPYRDVGCDGLSSLEEEGYHPLFNPDPSGDDFHWRDNPTGTEGDFLFQGAQGAIGLELVTLLPETVQSADRAGLNHLREGLSRYHCDGDDPGEPYEDVGLDGVALTAQLDEGGFDWGEGNGVFDYNPNLLRFIAHNPAHHLYRAFDDSTQYLRYWIDGGIRDLFNFAIAGMYLAGRIHGESADFHIAEGARTAPVRLYDSFIALDGEDLFLPVVQRADALSQSGWHVFLRYGDPEASQELIDAGDGGHVGTQAQVLSRLLSFLHWTHRAWKDMLPERPRASGLFRIEKTSVVSEAFGGRYHFDVALPPGYDDPENSEERYPVVYFMHGYGQRSEYLHASQIVFQSYMISGLWPKTIFVYADGSCRYARISACSDGVDNDQDGFIDLDDPHCQGSRGRSELEGENPRRCEDGVDNDQDGLTDLDDPGCIHPNEDDEGECREGTFYVTHTSWEDGREGGRDYEAAYLDMMDHVDETYRVMRPEMRAVISP